MAGELRLYVIRVGGRQRAQVFGMVVRDAHLISECLALLPVAASC